MNINKELNLLNQKIVYDLTKFTTTDYTGHLSCVVWFVSCNLRCKYCYNDNIVFAKKGKYDLSWVLDFLKSRIGLLDSVVLSGGEATLYELETFCREVKNLGFKIKLDTNGTNFLIIKKLIEMSLIDYIAVDFKAPKNKYREITKRNLYDKWLETVMYLVDIDFDFEIRTTINSSLLSEKDINSMINTLCEISYKNIYYLQNFLQTSSNIGNIKESKKLDINKIVKKKIPLQWRN